jgi:hypothetical protein
VAGPLDRLRRALGRPSNDDTNEPEWPRATGPALTVEVLGRGHRRGEDLELVPLDGHEHLGALLSVRREGPSLRRPGDLAAATDEPLHRITELTVVQAGALEHRDSLGHRGSLPAPATRLASAGAGIVSEVGPDRHLRRDGGMLDVLTIRWAQMSAVTPTVRIGEAPPARRQGRSEVRVLLGRADGAPTAAGLLALQIRVAAGATVDVEVPPEGELVLVVLAGDALVGAGHPRTGPGLGARTRPRGRRRRRPRRGAETVRGRRLRAVAAHGRLTGRTCRLTLRSPVAAGRRRPPASGMIDS